MQLLRAHPPARGPLCALWSQISIQLLQFAGCEKQGRQERVQSWLETQVDKEAMRHRFQQVGGALRTLLASQTGYEQAVELQRAEAKEFSTVERAFAGELNNVEGKTMPTSLPGSSRTAASMGSYTMSPSALPVLPHCLSRSTMTSSCSCGAIQALQGRGIGSRTL